MSDDGSVEIKDLVKTYVDDRGRPTFTAVKNISLHKQYRGVYGAGWTFRMR